MDGTNRSSSANQSAVPGGDEKRRRRSVQERRQIVEETLKPGASVARVARAHGVNANQVFYWRTLYRRGRLGGAATAALERSNGVELVAIQLTDAAPRSESAAPSQALTTLVGQAPLHAERAPAEPGTIHIQLRKARLRIEGPADPVALRAVLEALGG